MSGKQAASQLGHNVGDYVAEDIRKPKVTTSVSVGQLLVIEPEEVQHGRVQIMHVNPLIDGVVAVFVGGTMPVT